MSRVSILFVVGEETAPSIHRLVRGGERVVHVATSAAAARQALSRWRSIGVMAIEVCAVPEALALGSELRAMRPEARFVAMASHRVLDEMVEGVTGARLVAAPWTDKVLLAAVEGAACEAEALRRARLAESLAARRLQRVRQLEAAGSAFSAESARRLSESNARLRQAVSGLARLVAVLSEGGDPDTGTRRERVARTAVALARRMGWSIADVEDVRMAALLADVGRTLSGGATTAFDLDGAHAERSATVLSPLPFSRSVIAGVRHHHERWDGCGGPTGLRGADIPRLARLLSLSESFVEFVDGDETYEGMSEPEAAAQMARESGRAHDPEMIEALLQMVGDVTGEPLVAELEMAGGKP